MTGSSRPTVAPHGRYDERRGAEVPQSSDCASHEFDPPRHATASGTDRDLAASSESGCNGCEYRSSRRLLDIVDRNDIRPDDPQFDELRNLQAVGKWQLHTRR